MKRSNLFFLPFLLGASLLDACKCERVECIRNSDCPACYGGGGDCCTLEGECVDPNAEGGTGGSDNDGTPDPSGGGGSPGGGCDGFEFEAEAIVVGGDSWGCENNTGIFYPLDSWTVAPRFVVFDVEEAQTVHEAGVCRDGAVFQEDFPLDWETHAQALADDLLDRCLTELLGTPCDQPGGVFVNPRVALCEALAAQYGGDVEKDVPKMERVGCTAGTIFPCQGPDDDDEGADGSSGGAGAVTAGWEVIYELDLDDDANETVPLPWDFSDVYCGRRGDCKVTEEFAASLWAESQRFEDDGVKVYAARVPCLECPGGYTMGLELRLRHAEKTTSAVSLSQLITKRRWKPSQTEQLFEIFGLESGDTIISIAYGASLDSMSPLESVAGGRIYDLAAERFVSGALRGVYQAEVIDRRGRYRLRTVTVE